VQDRGKGVADGLAEHGRSARLSHPSAH
jgi:hypothetical protein